MKIKCLNDDETKEYKLPKIPYNIQQDFLSKVNKYIKYNKNKKEEKLQEETTAMFTGRRFKGKNERRYSNNNKSF